MKKTISRIFLIALSVSLAVSAFAGCARSSSANYGESFGRNMSAPAASSSAAPAAAAQAGVAMENGRSAALGLTGKTDTAISVETKAVHEAEDAEMDDAAMPGMEMPAPDGGIAGPAVKPVMDSRKIIKNVDMRLQTLTFDTSVEDIPKIAESFGGYVQDSYVEGRDMYNERGTRNANFTVRIPAERLDSFVNSVGSEFHVISKSQNSQDITENYYDSKARLDALKVQEERLMEMLRQAAELEYLLQVEKELMNVRYEIESLTSSLNRMDSYVSMSTVTIWLSEVVKYEPVENVPVTFGERISRALQESWKSFGEFSQNFAVWFVYTFPFLLLLAVIAFVIVLILRKSLGKGKAKKAKNTDASPEPSEAGKPEPAPENQSPSEEEKH